MKTKKQFEKQELSVDEFLNPMDRIDYELYSYILCGWVGPNFDDGTVGQNGECSFERDGTDYYSTVMTVKDKYYYLGQLPSFSPGVY